MQELPLGFRLNTRNLGLQEGNQQQKKIKSGSIIPAETAIPSWSEQFQSDGLEALYTHTESSVSIPDFAVHQDSEIQRFDTRNLILQEGKMVQYGTVVAAEQSGESHVTSVPSSSSLDSFFDGLPDIIPTLSSADFEPPPFNIQDIGDGEYMGFYLPLSDLNSKLIPEPELAPALPGFDSISQHAFDAETIVRELSGNHVHYGLIQDNTDQRLNKRNLGSVEENQQNKKIKRGSDIAVEQSDGIGMVQSYSLKESETDGLEAPYLHTDLVSIPEVASNQGYEIEIFDTRNLSLEEANKQQDVIQCGSIVAANQSDESHVASMPIASSSMDSIFDGLPNIIPTVSSADFDPPTLSFNIEDIGDGEYMGFYLPLSDINSKLIPAPELAPALPGFDSTSQDAFDVDSFVRELSLAT